MTIGTATTKMVTIITPVLTLVLVIALVMLINHTKIGMAMRAVSKDFETSQLMGIKINRVISVTFVIGSFLAGVGSLLYFTQLYHRDSDLRRHAGPEGVCGGGVRRYRQRTRGCGGRVHHRHLREHHQGPGCDSHQGRLSKQMLGLTTFSDAFTFALLIVILIVKPDGSVWRKDDRQGVR